MRAVLSSSTRFSAPHVRRLSRHTTRAMSAPTTRAVPAPMVSELYAPVPVLGRCALITGASSGIGKATAERLAELGCRLVVAARREERLEELACDLHLRYGATVHCVVLDVTDTDAVLALPKSLPKAFADVSILVNNAGGALGTAKVTENDMDDVTTMLDANIKGVVATTRAFSPGMVSRGEGTRVGFSQKIPPTVRRVPKQSLGHRSPRRETPRVLYIFVTLLWLITHTHTHHED